jgi:hypothetical protein
MEKPAFLRCKIRVPPRSFAILFGAGKLKAALLASCILLIGGCAGPAAPSNPAPSARAAQPGPAADDKRFIVAPELEHVLHVVNVRLNHPSDAYLKIQVTVQNMTDARQRFLYRIDWFDADGLSLPLQSGEFIPWMLLPREVAAISVAAPLPTAADFGIAFVPAVK